MKTPTTTTLIANLKRRICLFVASSCIALAVSAQVPAAQRVKVGVVQIDSNVPECKNEQMGSLVRLELQKLDSFNVMDKYEITTLLQKANLKAEGCFGRLCVVEMGKALGAQKMITGSIEHIGDQLVYTLQYVDVATEAVERTRVMEFLFMTNEVQNMTTVMLRSMFNQSVDGNVLAQLQKPNAYDARSRQTVTERLRLDGPRMGVTYFTGETARIIGLPKSQGGFGAVPVMFQFGYQFERQYLSSGDFQALFEFLPMVTGLDQGIFIPSMTIMNGIRSNKRGWEFAFGPTISLVTIGSGYYDGAGNWLTSWAPDSLNPTAVSPVFEDRLDSRGTPKIHSSFVFAVGKTFRSGNLSIPVNVYGIPSRDGWRFGLSIGYNGRNGVKK